jgi:chorismate synthase
MACTGSGTGSDTEAFQDTVTEAMVEANIARCPDPELAERMIARIDEVRRGGNSVGGVVAVVVRGGPPGWGAPVFDKLEADLAKACMSLPASKGFEVGSGFGGTMLTGYQHNDEFYIDGDTGRTRTRTNRSGGIQGGISNGENIVLRVAFKPTSTIGREQNTVTREGEETTIRAKGRHDPCVLPRAVPMVESMVALVLLDAFMQHHAQCNLPIPLAELEGGIGGFKASAIKNPSSSSPPTPLSPSEI